MIEIILIIAVLGFGLFVTAKLFKSATSSKNSGTDTILGSGGTDEDPKPPYQHDRDTK